MKSIQDGFQRLQTGLTRETVGAVVVVFLIGFFVRLVQVRTRFRRLIQEHDVPILPHSFLLGHLVSIGKVAAHYPFDFSKLAIPYILAEAYPEIAACGVIYMDVWPLGGTTIAVLHPDMIAQFTQDKSMPKHPMVTRELGPMTHGNDLVTMEGGKWKAWRATFNPGFSAKNLTALLPAFVEEIQVFKEILTEAAISRKILNLEEVAQRATVDIIFQAAMGTRLHSQTRNVPFVKIMQNQISWLVCDYSIPALIKVINPYRYYKLWRNNVLMDSFLKPIIEREFSDLAKGEASGPKTITNLALKGYMAEASPSTTAARNTVDPIFMQSAIAQLKIFIFAGHDTTASTISFAYSRLYKTPAALATLRAEHDAVLGSDPKEAYEKLTANPNLLNQLPYTAGVIKETLRFYPPAATARKGDPDTFLVHPETRKRFPTGNNLMFGASFATHRLPAYWERADEFLPERWLAREGDALYPRRNAWRPFEQGPRNCIGQELAQQEMRAILAMTVRELEFESAYPDSSPEVLGDKAYQVMTNADITGHVKDGFPVRIRLRKT